MSCQLCRSENVQIIYKGKIRDGGLGKYTSTDVSMYQCLSCNTIWHENSLPDVQHYYASSEYRTSLEGGTEEERFYKLHDKETLKKFQYTGTDIFRNKVVGDIGCGCGAFLDFLKGVAKEIIAIEPSEIYRAIMQKKGFNTFPYAKDAKKYRGGVDVVTSFDVIEHVEDPEQFMKDVFILLGENGTGIIGTPTDAPVMRNLLGELYERELLFSVQHLWIFSEYSLKMLARNAGFEKMEVKYFQRYGLGNLLGWLREKRPCSDITENFITATLDNAWKSQCSANKLADYIVLYVYK